MKTVIMEIILPLSIFGFLFFCTIVYSIIYEYNQHKKKDIHFYIDCYKKQIDNIIDKQSRIRDYYGASAWHGGWHNNPDKKREYDELEKEIEYYQNKIDKLRIRLNK